jgi:hypothetical protein
MRPAPHGLTWQRERWLSARHILHERFGKPPSDYDIAWRLLNQDLIAHGVLGNWALYRQTRFLMGELLHAEGKWKAALRTYLEVLYLDLNGAQDRGRARPPRDSTDFPVANPKRAKVAWTVVKRCLALAGRLQLNGPDLREWFYRAAAPPYCNMRLPIDPQRAWRLLTKRMRLPIESA